MMRKMTIALRRWGPERRRTDAATESVEGRIEAGAENDTDTATIEMIGDGGAHVHDRETAAGSNAGGPIRGREIGSLVSTAEIGVKMTEGIASIAEIDVKMTTIDPDDITKIDPGAETENADVIAAGQDHRMRDDGHVEMIHDEHEMIPQAKSSTIPNHPRKALLFGRTQTIKQKFQLALQL